jgi:hypothetical protein
MQRQVFRGAVAAAAMLTLVADARAQMTDINGLRVRRSAFVGDPGTIKTITPDPVSNTLSPVPSTLIYHETNFTNTGAGFQANRADFHFSDDGGVNPKFFFNTFENQDAFDFSVDLTLEADSVAPRKEAGFRIDFGGFDGQFIVNTDANEIAAFGGTLPFYSFNVSQGVSYTAGETINMRMVYTPPVLDEMDDVVTAGTIEYIVDKGAGPVTSGPLEFTGEEGGIIDGSIIGVYVQATGAVNDTTDFVRATFSNFDFVGPPAVPTGDFDDDGDVDGDDFLSWQSGFGTTSGASREQGDSDMDGDVDDEDFTTWQAQFGDNPPLAAAAAGVPEPGSAGLAAAGLLALGFQRSRRGGRRAAS